MPIEFISSRCTKPKPYVTISSYPIFASYYLQEASVNSSLLKCMREYIVGKEKAVSPEYVAGRVVELKVARS